MSPRATMVWARLRAWSVGGSRPRPIPGPNMYIHASSISQQCEPLPLNAHAHARTHAQDQARTYATCTCEYTVKHTCGQQRRAVLQYPSHTHTVTPTHFFCTVDTASVCWSIAGPSFYPSGLTGCGWNPIASSPKCAMGTPPLLTPQRKECSFLEE